MHYWLEISDSEERESSPVAQQCISCWELSYIANLMVRTISSTPSPTTLIYSENNFLSERKMFLTFYLVDEFVLIKYT